MPASAERSLLLDHFRLPDGYRFDGAIETAAGDPVDDDIAPLALFEALPSCC